MSWLTRYLKMNKKNSHEDGFTVMELTVAIALMVIVTGGALMILQSGTSVSIKSMDRAAAHGAAREALSIIEEEIREAQIIKKTDGSVVIPNTNIPVSEIEFTRKNSNKVTYFYDSTKKEIRQRINGDNRLVIQGIENLNITCNDSGLYQIQLESRVGNETIQFSVYAKPRTF